MTVESLVALPVLSVRQPWASYIVGGLKSVELRTWSTGYRGWLWIHASKRPDLDAMAIYGVDPNQFQRGGLIGIGLLAKCKLIETAKEWQVLRNEHRSPGVFHHGVYGWQFHDVIALTQKIECRGELGLFTLDELTQVKVKGDLEKSMVHNEFVEAVSEL